MLNAQELDKLIEPLVDKLNAKGVRLDIVKMRSICDAFEREMKDVEDQIQVVVGPIKLHKKAGIKDGFAKEGFSIDGSSDDLVLQDLERRGSKFAPLLRRWRSLQRKVSTGNGLLFKDLFVSSDGLTAIIYPEWKVSGTVTGRINCANPSIVLIDKAYREAVIPFSGNKFVSWDWSNFELRVGASVALCHVMCAMFEADVDLHAYVASLIFEKPMELITAEERANSKAVSLGIWYGLGVEGVVSRTGLSIEKADSIVNKLRSMYTEIIVAIENTKAKAESSLSVSTEFGRERKFHDELEASKSAWATRIQGTAADLFKFALIDVSRLGVDMILAIPLYDGAIYEVPEEVVDEYAELIKKIVETRRDGFCKFTAIMKVGDNWGEVS